MPRTQTARPDIYATITDQIVNLLETGVKPWTQPWHAAHAAGPVSRPLRHNGEAYSGINTLILWCYAMERGHSAPIWMTFQQARSLGAYVRKGETSAPVVYAGALTHSETDQATGEETESTRRFLKSYRVFNVDQIEGLPAHYYARAEPRDSTPERITHAEAFFTATGAEIRHGGSTAFYSPSHDFVQMPDIETFESAEDYYATLGHECTHWTRHASRLDRSFGRERFGDQGYAQEELVAELGAAFLCADLGLDLKDREDHAAYIASWLKVLKNDKRAIFTAAAHAQRAADYLHSVQSDKDMAA